MQETIRAGSTGDEANTFFHHKDIKANSNGEEVMRGWGGPWKPREKDKGLADERREERDLSKLQYVCEDGVGVLRGAPQLGLNKQVNTCSSFL